MAKSIRSKKGKRLRSLKRRTWLKATEEKVLRTTRGKLEEYTGVKPNREEGEDMIKGLVGYAKAMADSAQTSLGNHVHLHPEEQDRRDEAAALLAAAAAGDATAAPKKAAPTGVGLRRSARGSA